MPAALKPRRGRALVEQVQVGGTTPALDIDEAAGVIRRVKVLGRFSRNGHGLAEAENGSEYTPDCMRSALAMYEGAKIKTNHPPDRARPAAERDVGDIFGVLKNARVEADEKGEPAVWADLHYLASHPLAPRVVEDVRKGLGVYGLSHNAAAKRERFDRAARRLVIEELAIVRSVDLVDRPATNRNLWESHAMPQTVRQVLEAHKTGLSAPRLAWLTCLLEDDAMAPVMDADAGTGPEGAEPEDKLWAGFQDAITAILSQYKEDGDADAAFGKIKKFLKAHAKLTGDEEPDADDVEEEYEGGEDDDKKKKDAMESLPSEDADVTPEKAKKILKDGTIRGKPLTDAQRGMFGAIAGRAESEELRTLRAEKACRQLCESLRFSPTQVQLDALAALPEAKRKPLIESFKGQGGGARPPRSGYAPAKAGGKGREAQESETGVDAAESLRVLHGD